MNILIVGAGIGGITTALALTQRGYTVQLFEQASSFRPTGAGIVLANNALRILEELGVDQEIAQRSVIPRQSHLMSWKGEVLASLKPFEKNQTKHTFAMLSRSTLFDILTAVLPPTIVSFHKKVVGLRQHANQVEILFEDKTSYVGDILLACDGIHSSIRKALLPQATLRYAGYTCWRGITMPIPDGREKVFTETWGARGRVGIAPIEGDRYYWYALKNGVANDPRFIEWTKADVQRNFAPYHAPIPEMLEQTPEGAIMKHDIYDLKPIRRYVFGRVALVGDAAHATTPNLGQGACQAIEDAYALAKALDRHTNVERALAEYQNKRRKPATKIVQLSWLSGKIAQLESPYACYIRDHILKLTT